MYEEITMAIEFLRQTPGDRIWFIPVRLDVCEVPEFEVGAGVTLRDFQWVDLYPDWEAGVTALANAIQRSLTRQAPPLSGREPRLPPLRDEPASDVLDAWRTVWTMLFSLKVAGDALLTHVDDHNLRHYAGLLDSTVGKVGALAFYFDRDDFEQLEALLHGALTFRRGKTDIRQALRNSAIDEPTFDTITRAIDSNVKEFEQFSQLLEELRDRYAVRTAAAPGHPVSQGDARGQRMIAILDAAAKRSKRRAEIRRAAEALVRRGEVTLTTDCPLGHGKLREWDGLPRCWECGWPWKHFDPQKQS
jgi:hypothetical protein